MKNNNQLGNLSTLTLVLIIVLFLIGVVVSIWGAVTALRFKNNKIKEIDNIFKDKKYIKAYSKFEKNQGIFALTFLGYDLDDFFVPIYIFETDNFSNYQKILLGDIANDKNNLINEYIQSKNITIKDIIFVQLEDELNGKTDFWIQKTKSEVKGFNK